jgi:hypothetical protein
VDLVGSLTALNLHKLSRSVTHKMIVLRNRVVAVGIVVVGVLLGYNSHNSGLRYKFNSHTSDMDNNNFANTYVQVEARSNSLKKVLGWVKRKCGFGENCDDANQANQNSPNRNENDANQNSPNRNENDANQNSPNRNENDANWNSPNRNENDANQNSPNRNENDANRNSPNRNENDANQNSPNRNENGANQNSPNRNENDANQNSPNRNENDANQNSPNRNENDDES